VASDAFSPRLQGGAINGRDEDGFVSGSLEQRSARKYIEASERVKSTRNARRRELRSERGADALICPENVTPHARYRARKAAEALGVECPEWAEFAPRVFSDEHKRKLSEARKRAWGRG
jgi:hypothetical protein